MNTEKMLSAEDKKDYKNSEDWIDRTVHQIYMEGFREPDDMNYQEQCADIVKIIKAHQELSYNSSKVDEDLESAAKELAEKMYPYPSHIKFAYGGKQLVDADRSKIIKGFELGASFQKQLSEKK